MLQSPSLQSSYVSLNPPQKSNFLCGPIEICVGEDCFETVASSLAKKPYAAVFLCEMAQKDYFADLNMKPQICKQLAAAIDNTTIYELNQLACDYQPTIVEFLVMCRGQDTSSDIYKLGVKLAELCKLTESMVNIETEVIEKMKQGGNDDDVINDEEDIATGFRDSAAVAAANDAPPNEVVYAADTLKNAMSKGDGSVIL